jgi:hypothetical protein
MRIFKNSWFTRFARKEKISDEALREAVQRAENFQVDADLGGGIIKQRIARPGQGKSKGYRTIILLQRGEKAFFVYGFTKGDQANIREDEEEQFKKMAKHVLALSDSQLSVLIDNGWFEEVKNDGEKISE